MTEAKKKFNGKKNRGIDGQSEQSSHVQLSVIAH